FLEEESIICNDKSTINELFECLPLTEDLYFTNLEFVKLILAKSPVLKKLIIVLDYEVAEDEDMLILKLLSSCPRASPLVEIIVRRHSDEEMQSNGETTARMWDTVTVLRLVGFKD
ncbi:hypothetical protein Tco_0633386, partial [Tanacetum coccineum]